MAGVVDVQGASTVRSGLRVRGVVQGVGFRPTVYRLAAARGLAGFVLNDGAGVWIEVEGPADEVERFPRALQEAAPPLARIEAIEVVRLEARGEAGFRVEASAAGSLAARGPSTSQPLRGRSAQGARGDASAQGERLAAIPTDAATCDACLRELFDPADRRHRYAFINCTDCGPRYSIIRDLPYDRPRTTMAPFALCRECRAEYEDPASRRFHAEPNACPTCGPRLRLLRSDGAPLGVEGDAALRAAAAALREGMVVAVKGLGGYLLACDARDERAVARLRARKRRPHKPFAIMARDLAEVARVARLEGVNPEALALLTSRARPIVLLPARTGGRAGVAPSVAPGLDELGLMLPYTGLHHLLLAEGPPLLVMTSGNRAEEPIARGDAEALERLSSIADLFLVHDREIHARVDDSVFRGFAARAPSPVRRARGFVPDPLPLPDRAPPLLAVGAELKNTVCYARGREAFLSPHVGDLAGLEAHRFFEEVIRRLADLLDVQHPTAIAHDLHPDYHSTRWALSRGMPRIGVQHHHAHLAACLAEHGRAASAIGVAFDGTGCGPAGEAWGGEIVAFDLGGFRRLAHLRALRLPGGEAAIRAPWRLACAALVDAGEPTDSLLPRIGRIRLGEILQMLSAPRGGSCPPATGAGRWFDAVSALCAVREEISYEGQAAIELEALARNRDELPEAYPFAWQPSTTTGSGSDSAPRGVEECDLRPTVRAIAADLRAGTSAGSVSARFHETLARVVVEACLRARELTRLESVALSGGCFQNRRLTERAADLLEARGFEVLLHGAVPPNDGGVSYGQAAVAAHQLARGEGR